MSITCVTLQPHTAEVRQTYRRQTFCSPRRASSRSQIVERLIAAGADVDKADTDDGTTPLYVAAQNGHHPVVERLIAAGADVDKATTDNDFTPLFLRGRRATSPSWSD